ncbi:MAG: peptide-methionine (S)-S-oxide reductase MsrA [Sneathiella sp.]|nr:peptide-methionine (S)-S-oxide reductase MsrA [Sneathiella sp.]
MFLLLSRFTYVLLVCLISMVGISTSARAADAAQTAIFAGGCFWCVESDFDHVPGVLETISGYIGGERPDPTYKIVSAGGSGYYESVKITFDQAKISYSQLLDIFWRSVDPTDDGGQFCDRGASYKTAIFTTSDAQEEIAQASKTALAGSGLLKAPIVTQILPATTFYPAEDYHQDYYTKNPVRYKFYRYSCGRDANIESLWGAEAHQGIIEH